MLHRLFVYGTLAPGKPNERVLRGVDGSWEEASVRGTLHPEGWGAALGYPGVVLHEDGDEVPGLLFTSSRLGEHWDRLDAFEGEGYVRVEVTARLRDGRECPAHVYALREVGP